MARAGRPPGKDLGPLSAAVAAAVRTLREEAGLTRLEMAQRLGIRTVRLTSMEQHETIISVSRLGDMALALGISPSRILVEAERILEGQPEP